jgi:hypothetical protein
MDQSSLWKLRTSSTIYPFEKKALKIWRLENATPKKWDENRVFFGMYHKGDYESFIKTKGKRIVVWAGGDIRNLLRGYAFSDGKDLWKSKLFSFLPWHWIFRIYKAEHFVENEDEKEKLASLGIKATVIPTFLEDINEFPVCYKSSDKPQVYISARKGQEREYGVITVYWLATKLKDYTFHIYGIDQYEDFIRPNIIYHGNVPQEQFNKEIKEYQCGLRLNKSDGLSEVTVKSMLLGQWPITKIHYDNVLNYEDDDELLSQLISLKYRKDPNLEAREYHIKRLNKFPFICGNNICKL